MKDLLNGWGLPAVTFLPLVGAAVMMLIPKGEENLHKVVALATSLALHPILQVHFKGGQKPRILGVVRVEE